MIYILYLSPQGNIFLEQFKEHAPAFHSAPLDIGPVAIGNKTLAGPQRIEILVYFLGGWGLLAGGLLFVFLVATNVTVSGRFNYLYPLIPFNPRAMARLLFRVKKDDFRDQTRT